MYAIINYFRKGPVCDDSNIPIPVGQVVCRNLGATLINITHYNEGPMATVSVKHFPFLEITNAWHGVVI